ncbi:MAG: permease [Candidatus Cloacimonadota bacterium]|nr:MAG: permease [Candidatus Cloacimonadota bacterium]PIE77430.1 MAG: permease [Candidatus Delongbacteria bacterium]
MLYIVAGFFLILSFFKSREKTKKSLIKGWKAFYKILPQFLGVIILIGVTLSLFDREFISSIIGKESGILGVVISSIVGSITLIPGFIAFPTAKSFLDSGAGYIQVATFVSTVMMVGVITFPIEKKYFGYKVTMLRNVLALIFSFIVGYMVGNIAEGLWF